MHCESIDIQIVIKMICLLLRDVTFLTICLVIVEFSHIIKGEYNLSWDEYKESKHNFLKIDLQ